MTMTTTTTLKPGDRVRFRRGPLGLIDIDEPHHFVVETIAAGENGTISDHDYPATIGWLYVDVGKHPLYVPEDPGALERLCNAPGCDQPPEDGGAYCTPHLDEAECAGLNAAGL